MKKFILLFIVVVGCHSFAQEVREELAALQSDPTEIDPGVAQTQANFETTLVKAFQNGNADKIASYFGENVDLAIGEKQNLYSKSQAQQILKNFFTAEPSLGFEMVHKGNAGQGLYFIGKLSTANEKEYRVTINSKTIKGIQVVTSLLIE